MCFLKTQINAEKQSFCKKLFWKLVSHIGVAEFASQFYIQLKLLANVCSEGLQVMVQDLDPCHPYGRLLASVGLSYACCRHLWNKIIVVRTGCLCLSNKMKLN